MSQWNMLSERTWVRFAARTKKYLLMHRLKENFIHISVVPSILVDNQKERCFLLLLGVNVIKLFYWK
jgi:hypothetical protein